MEDLETLRILLELILIVASLAAQSPIVAIAAAITTLLWLLSQKDDRNDSDQ